MTMQTDPRHPAKTGAAKRAGSPGRVVSWPDVLRALQSDQARCGALASYRASGHTADDFGTRRAARVAMSEALTKTEDMLESATGRMTAERLALRSVRRRLEAEVWP